MLVFRCVESVSTQILIGVDSDSKTFATSGILKRMTALAWARSGALLAISCAVTTLASCSSSDSPGTSQSTDAGSSALSDAATDAGLDAAPIETPCRRDLAARGVVFAPAIREIERPAGRPDLECRIEDPILIEPVVHGVVFRPDTADETPEPLFTACSLGLSIERMAQMLVERKVTDVVHFGTYGCRVIAGTSELSEHAVARALDVAAVRLEGGAVYSVLTDWEKDQPLPTKPADVFLHELVRSLFDGNVYNIILTPDFNADHRNHFHLDLTPGTRFLK